MIVINVLYRNTPTVEFNTDYYLKSHIPLARKLLEPALKSISVSKGISDGTADSKAEFLVHTQLHFDSLESFHQAFNPHVDEMLWADLVNYSNEPPVLQISEALVT
ncbi:MAG TPA: EthD family reductase [Dyella sp.]|uniref:EthD family reductase n=1 Tax=Dyella sp. TaxID=1869338 RepID=UPI002C497544|nr:EthD family reductase [Dyella sp.]HTV84832.1 EthD family reductase [Dyella sp.]